MVGRERDYIILYIALGGPGGVLVLEGVLIWVPTAVAEYDLSFNCAVLGHLQSKCCALANWLKMCVVLVRLE